MKKLLFIIHALLISPTHMGVPFPTIIVSRTMSTIRITYYAILQAATNSATTVASGNLIHRTDIEILKISVASSSLPWIMMIFFRIRNTNAVPRRVRNPLKMR